MFLGVHFHLNVIQAYGRCCSVRKKNEIDFFSSFFLISHFPFFNLWSLEKILTKISILSRYRYVQGAIQFNVTVKPREKHSRSDDGWSWREKENYSDTPWCRSENCERENNQIVMRSKKLQLKASAYEKVTKLNFQYRAT